MRCARRSQPSARRSKLHGAGAVRFVPLDLTRPEEGYARPDFGLDRLKGALTEILPEAAERLAMRELGRAADEVAARARPLIFGYAGAAAGAGAVPVPLAGLAGITGVQGLMLRALAGRYGVEWTLGRFAEFTGALGTGALLGAAAAFGGRELLKLVPFMNVPVFALQSATGFGLTTGLGFAACEYLGSLKRGQQLDSEAIRMRYKEGLRRKAESGAGTLPRASA